MASINIKQTLHITADICNIIIKNRTIINKYNRQQIENHTYYRTLLKNKNFKNIKDNKIFCSNFCGGNIEDCTCMLKIKALL